MLIGISGYIGSGKDTVAKMIQYLTVQNLIEKGKATNSNPLVELKSFEDWVNCHEHIPNYGVWGIKKFAGKLKQIVSILTGIPVADLEKQEVKDSELGEEWWYWSDTEYTPHISYKGKSDVLWKSTTGIKLWKPTVRWLLQTLGTDAMRDKVHPNIHVNALFTDYLRDESDCCGDGRFCPDGDGEMDGNCVKPLIYPNWIISDMRFPNEMEAVKQRHGITVRVNRPDILTNSQTGQSFPIKVHRGLHSSETSLDSAEFDYVIENNAGLPELLEQVKQMLIHYKLI